MTTNVYLHFYLFLNVLAATTDEIQNYIIVNGNISTKQLSVNRMNLVNDKNFSLILRNTLLPLH